MLETSKDVLYIVLSLCALWLTVFLCWVIYYVAMLLKQAYDFTKGARQTLVKFEALIDSAKGKLERSGSHLMLLVESVGQLAQFVIKRRAAASTDSPKSKKSKK